MGTKYLRQFPGKRRFESVSHDDWMTPLPHKDIAGYGHVLRLEADVRVWAPDGELIIARKWPSRSYIRNFARLMRNTFGSSVQLVDRAANLRTTHMNTAAQTGMGLFGSIFLENDNANTSANSEYGGAAMSIGQGVAAETHTRNDLVSRFGEIISCRQGVRTTVLDTSTTTIEITAGIVNGTAASVNITEIALFIMASTTSSLTTGIPFSTLVAYDGITSTPLAAGGVIAPRYTMDFPI